jgi:alanyl-tRNA synthetase
VEWTVQRVEDTFLAFMRRAGHAVIEGHSVLSPTDDVLFTTAGMHPLTPYLRGEPHPAGRRLADVQRCVRTTDVDEVGDGSHLTVFEMLGNWSLGDYFKETSIPQSFDLLTGDFGIDPHALYVTVFAGDEVVGRDDEAISIWRQVFADAGVDPTGRINPLGDDDNWWSNGPRGLCGPDTEIFVHVGDDPAPPFGDRPEFVEVWNNVFMTYDRDDDGTVRELDQRNVDTGMGLERITMFLNQHSSIWETDELAAFVEATAAALGVTSDLGDADRTRSLRIVTDHLRAAIVIAAAGIHPSATRQGYVLRKLVRRSVRHVELITGTDTGVAAAVAAAAVDLRTAMNRRWTDLGGADGDAAIATIEGEAGRFARTLRKGSDQLHRLATSNASFDGQVAFTLADTFGYPAELSAEEARRLGMTLNPSWAHEYDTLREAQRERSRA